MVDLQEHHGQKFSLKHLPSLIKKAALALNKDDPWRLIMFYGAEFTWAYAKLYGHGIKPKSYARSVNTKKSESPGKPKIEKDHHDSG